MNNFWARINNQDGSMILIALLLLVTLTIIGITSTSTTVTENRIAVNNQLHKMAFYSADSGIYSTPKLIRNILKNGDPIEQNDADMKEFTYCAKPSELADYADNLPKDFHEQLMGYDDYYDGGLADVKYDLGENKVRVDVERIGAQHVAGGGVEFAAGAEGLGIGGGGQVRYRLFAIGDAPRDATTSVTARYRYVVGVLGGL